MQPALPADITEGDGAQLRGGVALGPGLLLGLEALQRLKHTVDSDYWVPVKSVN